MERVPVSVGILDPADFRRVASALRAGGMQVERELDALGIVTGSVERQRGVTALDGEGPRHGDD